MREGLQVPGLRIMAINRALGCLHSLKLVDDVGSQVLTGMSLPLEYSNFLSY